MSSSTEKNKQLSTGSLVALIGILSAAAPIATDLYLPALPSMSESFATTDAVVNFTLVAFFLFMAIGMLVMGPLSDKMGRKPVMFASLAMFMGGAFLCAVAPNIETLIGLRVVQGLGGGGMSAVGTALVKDCFTGALRQKILVAVQAVSSIAPMVAPVLGSCILAFADWRATFIAQAIVAVLAIPFALKLVEPLKKDQRSSATLVQSLGGLIAVGKNPSFILLLLVVAVVCAPYMMYISAASYIYIEGFGLSNMLYSMFFAINAALSAVAAAAVVVVSKHLSPGVFLGVGFGMSLVSGVLVLVIGSLSPLFFLVSFGIFTLANGFMRPVAFDVLLSQQEGDTGSASALMNFIWSIFGSFGMLLIAIPWSSYVTGLGIVICVLMGIATVLYAMLCRSRFHSTGL